jgi:sulfite exporter TauE/SafE
MRQRMKLEKEQHKQDKEKEKQVGAASGSSWGLVPCGGLQRYPWVRVHGHSLVMQC